MSDSLEFPALEGLPPAEAAARLAEAALHEADIDPAQAARTLAAARARMPAPPPALAAAFDYAAARLATTSGDLPAAEEALRRAQAAWLSAGDSRRHARAFLGLTQILAMQGRYADAEAAAQAAVAAADSDARGERDGDPEALHEQAKARINLATLYHYQERHADALPLLDAALSLLDRARARLAAPDAPDAPDTPDTPDADTLRADRAHAELARANALTFLDRPDDAQAAYARAVATFDARADAVNRGRARTNLGRLLLRRGDYADALRLFDAATQDVLGVPTLAALPPDADLRPADELLLEQATAWLALNLLPEADEALAHAEALFRPAAQPYELAHTLYLRGLTRLRGPDPAAAAPLLDEALALFSELENAYWVQRTQTARAVLAQRTGDAATAAARLDALLAAPPPASGALLWDAIGRAEALILRGHLAADAGDAAAARAYADAAESAGGAEAAPLPSHAARIDHLRGRAARLAGDRTAARAHLRAAVDRLDAQRAALPLEEIRTAFLEDKGAVYAELLLALLDTPQPTQEEVGAAFDAVERARSRALLERLIATLGEEPADAETGAETGADPALDDLRRRLHWLYNALLGEGGGRGLHAAAAGDLAALLRAQEAEVQRLEGARAPLPAAARPVDLATFRAALAPDRQAVVYALAAEELLAFVVDREGAQVVRRLCTAQELEAAAAELRFQVGRAALGGAFLERHAARLAERLRAALHRLHTLVFAPLLPLIHAPRLLLLPDGALHGVPLHALWDGERYLLEQAEVVVAPSASLALQGPEERRAGEGRAGESGALRAWAGLAIDDAAIPAARVEVEAAARRVAQAQGFAPPRVYLEEAASLAGLRAAARADILHIATHGLFRSDNPFFSVLKLADGWIDVRELYRLPLAARLVVLSACESGAGQLRPGDEVIGLARGFLAAGARSLVATHWHVHDAGAAQLMEEFYRALTAPDGPDALPNALPDAGRAAAALRAAQRHALAEGQPLWFWAPFYVIGA